MKKIEPFLDDAPIVLNTSGVELKIAGIQPDSLGCQQVPPIAPSAPPDEQIIRVKRPRPETFGSRYYHWGINE